MHGSLAAFNILLSEENVVKISNIGQARKILSENNKINNKSNAFKWMAIESLTNHIFSSNSDVWSFGILLWEIFSLCQQEPYFGINDVSLLASQLQAGHRLEKPELATSRIARLITTCWNRDPKLRPTFRHLEEILGAHLETSVRNRYVDMNEPYNKLNQQVKIKGEAVLNSEGDYSLFQLITDYYYYYSKVIDYSIIYDY